MSYDNDCMAQPEGPRCGYHLLYLDAVHSNARQEVTLRNIARQHHRKGMEHSDGMHYRHTDPPEECDELFCYEARIALSGEPEPWVHPDAEQEQAR